jgi:opacity protein-like surface antigen
MSRKSLLCALAAVGFVAAAAADSSAQETAKTSPGGWAVVASDGKLQSHENAMKVTHNSAGVYDVKFDQKVSNCAANATIGGSTRTMLPGYIVLTKRGDTIGVHTFDALTALPADFKFNLNVACSSS